MEIKNQEVQERLQSYCDKYGADINAILSFASNIHIRPEELTDADMVDFENTYYGYYANGIMDVAKEMVLDHIGVCNWLVLGNYIDYDAIVQDMCYDGWHEENGHVFQP